MFVAAIQFLSHSVRNISPLGHLKANDIARCMKNIAHNLLTNLVPRFITTSLFLLAVYLKKPKGNLYERTGQCIATKHTDGLVSLLIPFGYTF